MVTIWYALIPVLFLFFSHSSVKPLPENIYPSWFFNPPPASPLWTVGYSAEHAYLDSALKAATREAGRTYAKNRQDLIKGEQGLATLAVGTITVGSTIKEYFDTAQAVSMGSTMKVLDYFRRGGAVAVLAAADSVANVPGTNRIDAARVPEPSWTTVLPDKAGYIYNSGLAPLYYNEFNSWLEAERKARINLALTAYTRVKFLGKKEDNIYFREFQVEETNVTLHDIEVVARWKDVQNRICYVLTRVPVGQQ
jgi:hypothetical protein